MPPEETPSAEPADTSTTTGDAAEPQTGTQDTNASASFDPKNLPPEAQEWLRQQLESEKYKVREGARSKAAEEARQQLMADLANALGLAGDGEEPPSAEELSAHLEQAQAEAYRSGVETQLYRLAGRMGFDAEAMLDSNRAMEDLIDALDENEGAGDLVPGTREFAAALEAAAAKALEKNPRLRLGPSGPRPDPSQGARGGGVASLDAQIAEAEKSKNFALAIRLKNQKIAAQAAQQR